ncbi:MAG: ral nucleoside transport system permease protein [Thermotogaceae bacterium]|jgi:simple sugar transport system permease protein|nr:ral nucleoside transport system permease protein [Thermotogaceae bacterium]MDN5337255.1 ral nucleoside transport system permease protein [Thermotogaceae bacterium]
MEVFENILSAAIRSGTPLLFATLGEIITERSGVLNLGLEGLMLIGAIFGFMAAYIFQNIYLAFILAIIAGAVFSLIHAFMTITLKANQTVSGLALTMLGTGLSGMLGRNYIGKVAPKFLPIEIPFLSKIPLIGKVLFSHDVLVYISYILVIGIAYFIFKTKIGMNLRAVGEEPSAADSAGINVFLTRYLATITGGALTAAGGAYLSLAYTSMWIENMSAGRGWIAIALVIFSMWNPYRALIGSYLFGGIIAMQLRLQAEGKINISPNLLMMLPYLTTLIIMIIFSFNENFRKRMGAPSALGVPYSREEKT